jgi:hypothetical protein
MPRRHLTLVAALLAAGLPLACGGGLAGTDFPGDPEKQYQGVAVSRDRESLGVEFVWQRGQPPSMDDWAFAPGALTGISAATPDGSRDFIVYLVIAPGPELFVQLGPNEYVARGNAVAYPRDAGPASPYYGADVSHWVLWFPSAIEPGKLLEWWLGGAHPAPQEFHYFAVNPAPCLSADDLAACVAELRERGAPDDAAARGLCRAPYRLSQASWSERTHIDLGTSAVPPSGCP